MRFDRAWSVWKEKPETSCHHSQLTQMVELVLRNDWSNPQHPNIFHDYKFFIEYVPFAFPNFLSTLRMFCRSQLWISDKYRSFRSYVILHVSHGLPVLPFVETKLPAAVALISLQHTHT